MTGRGKSYEQNLEKKRHREGKAADHMSHGSCSDSALSSSKNSPFFRIIKILDIGYTGAVFTFIGFFIGIGLNRILPKFIPQEYGERTSFIRLLLELMGHFWLLNTLVYVARNVRIPSPFHGWAGYDHWQLKELTSAAMFALVLTQTQRSLSNKMVYLVERAGRCH